MANRQSDNTAAVVEGHGCSVSGAGGGVMGVDDASLLHSLDSSETNNDLFQFNTSRAGGGVSSQLDAQVSSSSSEGGGGNTQNNLLLDTSSTAAARTSQNKCFNFNLCCLTDSSVHPID